MQNNYPFTLPWLNHSLHDPVQDYYTKEAFIFCVCESLVHQRRQWHPTPVLLPGKSHGWRRLEGRSPWGRWGSNMTEWLHFHFSLSCIGEGNGNPLQCSCLENPRDAEAWWAAVYGVTQSRTRLKWLSNSNRCIVIPPSRAQSCKSLEKNSLINLLINKYLPNAHGVLDSGDKWWTILK